MTPTSYYLALIAKSFGYERRNKRLADASSEMGLLREAEYQLGLRIWEKIEPIEELSVEYWNLRKQMKEITQLRDRLDELNYSVSQFHEERANILNEVSPEQLELEMMRSNLLRKMEELAHERDSVVRRAKEIRRTHEGLLTKIEVLQRDKNDQAEVKKVEQTIEELKEEFKELKHRRQQVAKDLDDGDKEIDALDAKALEFKQIKRDKAAVIFAQMGIVNRELSTIRSEMGNIETQIRMLQSEVGRYVSRYYKRNPVCGQVAAAERTMIEVMRMLRISIAMNHKLADFK